MYNKAWDPNRPVAQNILLIMEYMQQLVELFADAIEIDGYEHMFFSEAQFLQ